ncbi:MAG: hypothetical protein GY730_10215 [bacterium]|nr:hypothetical protein [bacterium]
MGEKRFEKRKKKPPIQLFPINAQKIYTSSLNQVVNAMIGLVQTHIFPDIERISNQAKLLRPTSDSQRHDDFSDEVDKIIKTTETRFNQLYPESQLENIALSVALLVASHNRREVLKLLSVVQGSQIQDIFLSESFLEFEISAFVKQNISLIKTVPERFFRETEGIIFRGIQQGVSHVEIRKQITERFNISRNRAKLIARDQVGKLNSQLTQLRQQSVGVKKYIWRTVGDERVRGNPGGQFPHATPSHFSREGKKFNWSEPPSDGHPGQPIQCRCYAEPIL